MKTKQTKKALTFGGEPQNSIASAFAVGVVKILDQAVKAHLVMFHGPNRYALSKGLGKA